MFDMFMTAFSSACSLEALVANFIGVALGIVFGALPGLTAVMGVALLIPLTFGFSPVIAFSSLLGMYCGAIYAGRITALLVGPPGPAAPAAGRNLAQEAAALTSLGYTSGEAAAALTKLDDTLPVEELIKLALRGMARR